MEFLHVDWLKQILQWQKPNGCYGQMKVSEFGRKYNIPDKTDYVYYNTDPETPRNVKSQRGDNVRFKPQNEQNNVVVQQAVGPGNRLQMKSTNLTKAKPAFNNIVNVGAGDELPLHDLDIKHSDNQKPKVPKLQPNSRQRIFVQDPAGRGNMNSRLRRNLANQRPKVNSKEGSRGGLLDGNAGVGGIPAAGGASPVVGNQAQQDHQLQQQHDELDPLEPLKWQLGKRSPQDGKPGLDPQQEDRPIMMRKLLFEKELGCKYNLVPRRCCARLRYLSNTIAHQIMLGSSYDFCLLPTVKQRGAGCVGFLK